MTYKIFSEVERHVQTLKSQFIAELLFEHSYNISLQSCHGVNGALVDGLSVAPLGIVLKVLQRVFEMLQPCKISSLEPIPDKSIQLSSCLV